MQTVVDVAEDMSWCDREITLKLHELGVFYKGNMVISDAVHDLGRASLKLLLTDGGKWAKLWGHTLSALSGKKSSELTASALETFMQETRKTYLSTANSSPVPDALPEQPSAAATSGDPSAGKDPRADWQHAHLSKVFFVWSCTACPKLTDPSKNRQAKLICQVAIRAIRGFRGLQLSGFSGGNSMGLRIVVWV
jgi:hypothetical protein